MSLLSFETYAQQVDYHYICDLIWLCRHRFAYDFLLCYFSDCARSANAKTYGDSINLAHSCVTAPTIVDLPPDQIYAAGVANCW